jgi:Secretion system C-terminal sorting domain
MKKKLLICLLLINVYLLANAATPPIATISYNTPFCQSSTLETVTITGTMGGTFTAAPFSLSINPVTGDINPSTSAPGAYLVTYSIPAGINPAFSTVAIVTISAQPNAGINGSVTVCESSTTTIDLFSLIYGEQLGGTWVRVIGTGGTFDSVAGTFTPAPGATTSSFQYTIVAPIPCGSDTSVATITMIAQPNAGTDGSTIASNSTNTSIDLYSIISGFQPGGTWTRTSGVGGTFNAALGTFNPYPDATSSTFSYTVSGLAPCVNDSSVVTVSISSVVIPTFSPIEVCSSSEPPVLPLESNNGILGTWTPSVIDTTQSGTYTFTPDSGQSAVPVTLDVQIIPSPTATIVVPDTVVIGSPYVVTFIGTSNAIITYQFNGGTNQAIVLNNAGQATIFFENAVPSTICLISASNVCTTPLNDCATVNVVAVPAPIGNPNQTFAQGATLADVIVTGTNIQWYDGANRSVNSNPLPLNTVLVNGVTYYASQTINGYVSLDRLAVTVQVTLATNSFDFTNLTYGPNPVENILNISSEEVFRKVTVYNCLGQAVFQQLYSTSVLKLDLGFLTKGNYFIKLESESKQEVIKILKN